VTEADPQAKHFLLVRREKLQQFGRALGKELRVFITGVRRRLLADARLEQAQSP